MATKYDAAEIGALFKRGENIMQWICSREGSADNTPTAIAYSYDAQAGSYVAALKDALVTDLKQKMGRRLAALFDTLAPLSLLEAGVGEATSLAPILSAMTARPPHVLGFDISLSRLLFARHHLAEHGFGNVTLFTSTLDRIPLADSSTDIVLTIHAIEPNHGQEQAILAELLRVARRHLVLIEPSYELGSPETRARIERLGYVRDLPRILEHLGHPPTRVEPWGLDVNPANEAALILVEKGDAPPATPPRFVSPISGRPLVSRPDCWFCPDDGHAFPIIAGIPCLTLENGVLASKLGQFS